MDCKTCCQPDESKELVITSGYAKDKAPGIQGEFPGGEETDPGYSIKQPTAAEAAGYQTGAGSSNKYEAEEEKKEEKYVAQPPARVLVNGPKKQEITVTISKKGQDLGLDVDYGDKVTLQVVKVKEGIIQDWNNQNKQLPVVVGDRIIAANGEGGSTDKIITEIQNRQKDPINLTVLKSNEVQFTLDKESADTASGLELTEATVVKVGNGPFKQYNTELDTSSADFALKPNDKIIEVNGRRSADEISKELENTKRLIVVVYQTK